jgi:two-component system CheB/CheR fusion protein
LPDERSVLVTALWARARDGADVVYRELQITTEHGPRRFDLRARGVNLADHGPLIALFFEGLREYEPDPQQMSPEGVGSETRDRMELLERELRQTRESLQATIEELESSNEELQATNEELIAANEELQSTNEELQSVNEELHTVNAEYSEKVNELTVLNEDMDRLFASVDVGILLLDEKFFIRRFNTSATAYFNVLAQDVGRPLMHLSHRLRYPQLLDDCAQALRNPVLPIWRRVATDDGRQVQVQIRGHEGSALGSASPGRSLVVTVTDTTSVEGTQQQLSRLAVALEHSPVMIAVVDADDQIVHANGVFASSIGRDLKSLRGATLTQLVHPSERDRTREALARTRAGSRWRGVMRTTVDGVDRFDLVRFVPATASDASVVRISEILDDRFVAYDRDRAPDEPTALGPVCYCLWTKMENQRVVDARVVDLLELASEREFDLADPHGFASAEDAVILRELVERPDSRGARGFCFPVLKAVPPRIVQIRIWPVPREHEPDRLLVEVAELPRAVRGFRATQAAAVVAAS